MKEKSWRNISCRSLKAVLNNVIFYYFKKKIIIRKYIIESAKKIKNVYIKNEAM